MSCKICGREMVLEVLHNHSGWYIGYACEICGPQTRETGYFLTQGQAEGVLEIFQTNPTVQETLRNGGLRCVI